MIWKSLALSTSVPRDRCFYCNWCVMIILTSYLRLLLVLLIPKLLTLKSPYFCRVEPLTNLIVSLVLFQKTTNLLVHQQEHHQQPTKTKQSYLQAQLMMPGSTKPALQRLWVCTDTTTDQTRSTMSVAR